MAYIKSANISVYPAGFRSTAYTQSKLTTETNITSFAGRISPDDDAYFDDGNNHVLIIHGYVFVFKGDEPTDTYAHIKLRDLEDGLGMVLAPWDSTSTADTILDGADGNFRGLFFSGSANENGASYSVNYTALKGFQKGYRGQAKLAFNAILASNDWKGQDIVDTYQKKISVNGAAAGTVTNIYAPLTAPSTTLTTETFLSADVIATNIHNIKYVPAGNITVGKATDATNVTTSINGKSITAIFETDGVTVKKATTATYDSGNNKIVDTYQKNISVNGATTGTVTSIYAPTGSGTSGQYLQSQGANKTPTWATITIPEVPELTRTATTVSGLKGPGSTSTNAFLYFSKDSTATYSWISGDTLKSTLRVNDVSASTNTVSGASTAKSLKIGTTDWNLPTGGGGGTNTWRNIKVQATGKTTSTQILSTSTDSEPLQLLKVKTNDVNDNLIINYNTYSGKTTPNGEVTFDFSNTPTFSSVTATSFTATSDERLKENIKDYKCEKSILDLPIKEFDFKENKKHAIGCIAQDLKEICPEIVHENEEGYLSIEENKLVYLLLQEVKNLKKEIEELKNNK